MTTPFHPIRKVFHTFRPPREGIVCHLVHFEEREDSPEFWTVRLYRDNFDSFSAEDKMVIFNWVSDIIKSMRIIEPYSYVEVFERMPR